MLMDAKRCVNVVLMWYMLYVHKKSRVCLQLLAPIIFSSYHIICQHLLRQIQQTDKRCKLVLCTKEFVMSREI